MSSHPLPRSQGLITQGGPQGHSPNLGPSEYSLFPKMRKELSGRNFDSDDDVTYDYFLEGQDANKEGICMLRDPLDYMCK